MNSIKYEGFLRKLSEMSEKGILSYSEDAELAPHSTFKIGGEADLIVKVHNREALAEVLRALHSEGIKYTVIGNGSNILFSDNRYEGVIILTTGMTALTCEDNVIEAQCGYSLTALASRAQKMSLTGLEFAYGIPGSVGRYGIDALKYFLLREYTFGQDGVFTNEVMLKRMNYDLANDLGNLVSRTVSMIEKYCGGKIPAATTNDEIDDDLKAIATGAAAKVEAQMDKFAFNMALEEIWILVRRANKYIDEKAPWVLAKDEAQSDRLKTVLYNLVESICIGTTLLESFMPKTAEKILGQLNAEKRELADLNTFGKYPSGNKVTEKPEILFARLDINEVLEKVEAMRAANAEPEVKYPEVEPKEEISIDDFFKVQFRVGEVLKCEPVPKAKKLLCSQIRIGNEVRQIVSGIAMHYKPEEMVGKKVAVVTNLKPVKICGVLSEGMILAASDNDGNLSVLTVDKDILPGSEIC